MFDVNNITYNRDSRLHTCSCLCNSPKDAEYLVASCIHISRMLSMSGNMYTKGSIAYIEAYLPDDVIRIANCINEQIQ